jgi:membrane complex biogenesis BtpA family protein
MLDVNTRQLIGVVHLEALPSAGSYGGSFDAVLVTAMRDATALAEGGVDGIMVENFGDAPFRRGDRGDPVWPDVPAALAVVGRAVRDATGCPIGINCLRNDAIAALGAAVVAGAEWVRVNVLTGAYVTDQGCIDGDAARVAEYRKLCGVRVTLLADLLVKHAAPLATVDPSTAARDLVDRSGADGLIVTGARTGEPVDRVFLETVVRAAGDFPVWIGSGLTPHNARELWPRCAGAIVGSAFKIGGRVDARRVAELRSVLDACD